MSALAVAGTLEERTGVGPGWVAFVVVVALCVVTTLLWLSMRKQLGKIRFEEQETRPRRGSGRDGEEPPAP